MSFMFAYKASESALPAGTWSIETDGLTGGDISVSEADAVQTGIWQKGAPYNIDQLVKEVVVEDRVVGWRPETDGTRQEIPISIGSLFSHDLVNSGAYTVTVRRNGVQIGDPIPIPAHWYRAKYRLVFELIEGVWTRKTTLPFRPAVGDVSSFIASKHLPPYGDTGVTLKSYSPTRVPYEIMGAAGIRQDMGAAGERVDIGPVTEHQARDILNELSVTGGSSDAAAIVWDWAEASGSCPWHYRDELTRKPVSVFDYPDITSITAHSDREFYVEMASKADTGWEPDAAHQPALNYYPFLRTWDLYLLEELQAQATWTLAAPEAAISRTHGYGLQMQNTLQLRGWAWTLRSLFQCAKVSPAENEDTTGVLLEAKYFNDILSNTLDYFVGEFQNSVETYQTVFRNIYTTTGPDANREKFTPWQQSLFNAMIGWGIEMGFTGAHDAGDWDSWHTWSMDQAYEMLRSDGDWNRYVPGFNIYLERPDGSFVDTWAEAWTQYQEDYPQFDPAPTSLAGDGAYHNYQLGAVTNALHLGKTAKFQTIHDWYLTEQIAENTTHAKWAMVAPAE